MNDQEVSAWVHYRKALVEIWKLLLLTMTMCCIIFIFTTSSINYHGWGLVGFIGGTFCVFYTLIVRKSSLECAIILGVIFPLSCVLVVLDRGIRDYWLYLFIASTQFLLSYSCWRNYILKVRDKRKKQEGENQEPS